MKTTNQCAIGGPENSQSASSPIFTRHEAAAFARMSIRKLDQAKANGEIAFIQIGRSIRFSETDIQNWMYRQRVEARRN